MDDWSYKPAEDLRLPARERLRSVHRESGLVGNLAHLAWWSAIRLLLTVWERVKIEGRENIPPPPFILVANHCSHLDVLVLATALPMRHRLNTFPIAAGDAFFETLPMAAFSVGLMNALPMWRKRCGRHALEELRHRLTVDRCGYILFPEGTRSRTGEMGGFKPGIGMLIAGSAVPIVPCRLSGTFEALPPGRRLPRRRRINLAIGGPLVFSETSNDKTGWTHVAASLEAAIRALPGG